MIFVHFSVNGKAVLIDSSNISMVEECEAEQDGKKLEFTRIYLKQPVKGESESIFLDVRESVEKISKMIK